MGPDKRATKITAVYTRGVARAIVTKTNNKDTADLIETESQRFMKELGKSAPVNFYNRFKMHLKTELNIDVDSDYTCKWNIIEKCLYKALSKEQIPPGWLTFMTRGTKHSTLNHLNF